MECDGCYIGLVAFEFEFGGSDGDIEFVGADIDWAFLGWSSWHLLQVLDLFLQVGYLLLEREDGLPFELKLIALRLHIPQRHPDLLRKHLRSRSEAVFHQVLQDIFIQLRPLRLGQHYFLI